MKEQPAALNIKIGDFDQSPLQSPISKQNKLKEVPAMFKQRSIIIMIVAIVGALALPAFAQDLPMKPTYAPLPPTTGTVRFNVFKVGFIVGVGGGSGTLTYNGSIYPLSVGGISIGTIGIADMQVVGTASNLRNPADIAGTYGAASASLAVIGGAKVAQLQNEHGVVLQVQGVEIGVEASLDLGGMTITMQ
jgi:hypothetical protein